jgi:hypothetical protein
MRPKKVNIVGVEYTIEYKDKPSDVDVLKRESLWGQIDFWTRTIKIYDGGRSDPDIWETILHEVLHGIAEALKLKALGDDKNHDELDVLALALTDVLFRNGWLVDLV